jgi:hypothetical protein
MPHIVTWRWGQGLLSAARLVSVETEQFRPLTGLQFILADIPLNVSETEHSNVPEILTDFSLTVLHIDMFLIRCII